MFLSKRVFFKILFSINIKRQLVNVMPAIFFLAQFLALIRQVNFKNKALVYKPSPIFLK